MADLSAFPITERWAPKNPDIIQLYSVPTPNGLKALIALEEMGLPYESHPLTLADDVVKSDAFLSLSPNNKIPAMIDPDGPDGTPIGLFESGAILLYLSEKTGKFAGENASERSKITQWLMWQMGGFGPMLGQLGFFTKFAGKEIEDPRPRERFLNEGKRLLNVLNKQLDGQDWVVGGYSIADMAIGPWIGALDFYGAKDALGFDDFENVVAYQQRFKARPAVAKVLPKR